MAEIREKTALEKATEGLKDAVERESSERNLWRTDLAFVTLDQWLPEIRANREQEGRPCLTIDKIGQYRMQIINSIRKNPPAVKVRAVDDKADPETAKIFQGVTRQIEDISRAKIAYESAAEWAIDVGAGYFRFTTDYVTPDSFNQEIRIKPIFDPFTVYLGKHFMPDGSDANEGYIIEDIPVEEFNTKWPKAKKADAKVLDIESPFKVDDKSVRVAERFYFDDELTTLLRLADGQAIYKDDYAKMVAEPALLMDKDGKPVSRETTKRRVKWQKLTGAEILEEGDWAGKYIPIVKVTGHQKMVNGKKLTWGIVRPAIDSCRLYNYTASMIAEVSGLQPKTPFVGAVGQFKTDGANWARANRENIPYLQFDPIDVQGNALPAPRRVEPAPVQTAYMQQLRVIEHDIQTSLGMFKASVGEEQGDQSGRAIRALQGQSDTATFHFPSNVTLSVEHGGRIMVDLIPKIMDTKQIIRILGDDDKPQMVKIDPGQPEAVKKIQDANGAIKSIYNLNVGTYDVAVTAGPSYATTRMETVEVLGDAMKGNPNLVPVLGDLMFRAMDSKIAEQAADRLEKMLPPQLQKQPEGQPQIPPQVQQQMQQMQQQMQMMQQENQMLKSGAQEAQAKISAGAEEAKAKLALQDQEAQAAYQLKSRAQEADLALAREKAEAELVLARDKAAKSADLAVFEAKLKAQTTIEVARIAAEVDTACAMHKTNMEAATAEHEQRMTATSPAGSEA